MYPFTVILAIISIFYTTNISDIKSESNFYDKLSIKQEITSTQIQKNSINQSKFTDVELKKAQNQLIRSLDMLDSKIQTLNQVSNQSVSDEQYNIYKNIYSKNINLSELGGQKIEESKLSGTNISGFFNGIYKENELGMSQFALFGGENSRGAIILFINSTPGGAKPIVYVNHEYYKDKNPNSSFDVQSFWTPNAVDTKNTTKLIMRIYYTDNTYNEIILPVRISKFKEAKIDIKQGDMGFSYTMGKYLITYKCKESLNASILIMKEGFYPDGESAGSSTEEKTGINNNIWDNCHEEKNLIPSPETH